MLFKKLKTAINVFQKEGVKGVAKVFLQKLAGNKKDIINISDSYIDWLAFANAGMLTRGNLYCMDYAIQNLPSDSPIVEIGVFCGLSSNIITYYKMKHGVNNKLINCDKWEFEGAEDNGVLGESSISHSKYKTFVKDSYIRNAKMFSGDNLPFTVEMFSDEFFENWATCAKTVDVFDRQLTLGGKISFCFIDGNHSYEFAKRDYEHCDKFLESGGFILFDDSADDSGWGVCKVVQEVLKSGKYELIIKNPNYLFKKK